MSDEQPLLACPFCGGDAEYEHMKSGRWSVGCADLEGECMGFQTLQTFATRAEAAAAWNTRATPSINAGEGIGGDVHAFANGERAICNDSLQVGEIDHHYLAQVDDIGGVGRELFAENAKKPGGVDRKGEAGG